MEEKIITGYCRVLDQARMVEAVLEGGALAEVDCCYPDCVHAAACPIAGELRQLHKPPE